MIEATRQRYKMIAVLIATIGAGVPIWTQPARQIDFTDPSFLGIWLLIGVVAAFISYFFINLKTGDIVASFIIGYMIAVVGMFVAGILIANHVHSQLTLALAVAIGVGSVSGMTGSLVWSLIKRKKRKR